MKILVLCTYPIKNPRHGGQLRVRNIVDTYRAHGHAVEVVGVLGSEQYEREEGFLPFPGVTRIASVISDYFLMEDYAIGRLFAGNDLAYAQLTTLVRSIPDVIHVEHPWLFAFATRYIASNAPKAAIVYSSQNIEWRLKQDILSSYYDACTVRGKVDLVKKVELDAIAGADAIVCVSECDAEWLRTQAKNPVIQAANGVKEWQVSEAGRKEAAAITKGYRYALYCASAHPPNMTGFFNIFGGGFGSLKPDEKLVIAGGAGPSIMGDVRIHHSSKLAEKVMVAGIVNQACLEGLLDGAQCIVLPLTQGGGTNLKTAEALWAGKHIVTTTIAMRGFERFIGARGVHTADDPVAFKRTLRQVMGMQPLSLPDEDIDARRSVLWGHCLVPLQEMLLKLVPEGST